MKVVNPINILLGATTDAHSTAIEHLVPLSRIYTPTVSTAEVIKYVKLYTSDVINVAEIVYQTQLILWLIGCELDCAHYMFDLHSSRIVKLSGNNDSVKPTIAKLKINVAFSPANARVSDMYGDIDFDAIDAVIHTVVSSFLTTNSSVLLPHVGLRDRLQNLYTTFSAGFQNT